MSEGKKWFGVHIAPYLRALKDSITSVIVHADTKVASVSGNIVNNTDPQNPTVNETTTTLVLSNNVLSYTDERGNTTNSDMSIFLDDTIITVRAGAGVVVDNTTPLLAVVSTVPTVSNDFTTTVPQTVFVVVGEQIVHRVYVEGIRQKASSYNVVFNGTDTSVTLNTGVPLNTWVLIETEEVI